MQDINLNPGCLIGALVAGGITAVVVFGLLEADTARRGPVKLCAGAMFLGGLAGNFLWGLVAGSSEEKVTKKRPKRKITTPVDPETPPPGSRTRVRKRQGEDGPGSYDL